MNRYCFITLFIILSFSILSSSAKVNPISDAFQAGRPQQTQKAHWLSTLFGLNKEADQDNLKCLVCTLLIDVMEQYCSIHSLNIDDFLMNDFCKFFPPTVRKTCSGLINEYGAAIIAALMKSSNADYVCHEAGICNNTQCKLIPTNSSRALSMSGDFMKYINGSFKPERGMSTGWLQGLADALNGGHTPAVDIDGDFFSNDDEEMRGFDWRGRDCNDLDKNIHPGRKVDPYPGLDFDYNCNGISGRDPKTGVDYEVELCSNSGQLGVVVMGDSAGAHAEIPAQWATAADWNETVFMNILPVAMDEVDLPQFSGYTGWGDVGYTGPCRSVYKNMYQRNKCNFRDYQNIAVNGADSGSAFGDIQVLARNQGKDHPLLMFLELVGNDVCDHTPSFDVMTTPAQFQTNIVKILDYLDTVVPAGSHLVILGVANGSLLYDGVKDKMHPIGVSYPDFYDFLNCLEISFCWGWLNTNETVRQLTTDRAMELNDVYKNILQIYKAENYDLAYYDFPAQEIWDEWTAQGKDPYLLIEPADGFHPNQMFHALLADNLWAKLQTDHPEWIGDVNPNNDVITQIFGDQGGY